MGWSFRRSVKFGPFRMNLSKRGVGYSVGVPGARVTMRADGRVTQTVGIPGTGISSTSTLASAKPSRVYAQALPYLPYRPARTRAGGLGCLALIACVVVLGFAASHQWDAVAPFLMPMTIIVPLVVWFIEARGARLRYERAVEGFLQGLLDRFGEDNARRIVIGEPWQGATQEMVQVMYGPPNAVSTRVHKQTTAEVWKYVPLPGHERYAMRVEFENGVCVGWSN